MHGGVDPWTVTHSVYSAVLLNVQSTVACGAFYPAKAYHEGVDFPHICEDHKLVAVKCQWLFVHKVAGNLCLLTTCACRQPVLADNLCLQHRILHVLPAAWSANTKRFLLSGVAWLLCM